MGDDTTKYIAQDATRPSRGSREPVDWFKRTIDIVTLLVLIGGFYFAYDQAEKINASLQESRHNNDLAVWNSISQQWLAMDKMFIDNPEIRPYFYGGKDIAKSDPEFAKVHSYAIYIIDFIDYAASSPTEEKAQSDFIHPESWQLYFMNIFSNSPIVCRELLGNKAIYSQTTLSLGRRACAPVVKDSPLGLRN